MDTRRLLLATLLSVAVLILWQQLFPAPERPPTPPPVSEAPAAAPPTAEPSAGPVAAAPEEAPPVAPAMPEAAPEALPAPEPIEAASEQRLTLESDSYQAVFSNRGAVLVSLRLKQHSAAGGGEVDLVRQRSGFPYPLAITDRAGQSTGFDRALFAVERVRHQAGGESLEFRYSGAAGTASKRITLQPDGLLRIRVEVPGRTDWGLLLGPGIRNPTADETSNRFARRAVIYRQVDDTERLDPAKTDVDTLVPVSGLRWIGIQDTYFLNALVPLAGVEQVLVKPLLFLPVDGGRFAEGAEVEAREEEEGAARVLALVAQAGSGAVEIDSYWGAKEYDRLAALPYGLEETVELGWFRFLTLPLLKSLRWIYANMVANYGWAIILMTIAIRLLLFPLMHKSTVSMQKMQELNPKIQAIRQKYRSKLKDKQNRPNVEAQRKMNEEVMALYKSEGVNPAGGCLPLLLQLPVLFAFYNLLSVAIELRHAPWLGWIQDLSAPDPYYVLPVVMGASQFLQQKLTPSAADPMQRRLFQLMPIFFTVLFLGFPSGLVLYWLTNNLLGIAQQAIYLKLKTAKAAAAGAADKPGKSE